MCISEGRLIVLLLCVSSLVEDCPQGLKDCRNSSLGLDELLKHRAKDLQGREECQVLLYYRSTPVKSIFCWLLGRLSVKIRMHVKGRLRTLRIEPSAFHLGVEQPGNTRITCSVQYRGGNLLAPHDLIRFQFRGQRFDSKTIIDATIFLMFISMRNFLKYIYTSEFATHELPYLIFYIR